MVRARAVVFRRLGCCWAGLWFVASGFGLLPSGKVLIAGGEISGPDITAAEIYHSHTATLLPSGQVLVAGSAASGTTRMALASAELYGTPLASKSPASKSSGSCNAAAGDVVPPAFLSLVPLLKPRRTKRSLRADAENTSGRGSQRGPKLECRLVWLSRWTQRCGGGVSGAEACAYSSATPITGGTRRITLTIWLPLWIRKVSLIRDQPDRGCTRQDSHPG